MPRQAFGAALRLLQGLLLLAVASGLDVEQDDHHEDARDMALLESIDNTADVFLDTHSAQEEHERASLEAPIQAARAAASPQRLPYKLSIVTGKDKGASTKSPIYLTVHGTRGDTGEFSLSAHDMLGGKLQKGETAMVTKMLKDVGTITKVRMRNPALDGWQCASLKIAKAGATTEFAVNKWLMSPKQSTRWAHAEVEYMLMVKTGQDKKAGTKQPQYITIYGPGGSTGELMLAKSFQRDTLVSVKIKGRDVGKATFIKLHNKGPDEWNCKSVRMVTSHGSLMFTVNKWVSMPRHPKASVSVDKRYQVWVDTGNTFDEGTRGEMFIQFFGLGGATSVHLLNKGFDHGKKESIDISAKDVGQVTKIKLSTKSKDGWFCKTLDVLYGNKQRAHFDVNSWVQYPTAAVRSIIADVAYRLLVKTGRDAESDSKGEFSINIYGTLGVTRTLALKPADGFKLGTTARLNLHAKDVGDLTKVRLSTRSPDAWMCKDVTIWKMSKVYPFSVDKWVQFPLAATVDTNADIKYSLAIMTGNMVSAETSSTIYITLYGTGGQSRYLPLKTGFLRGSTETVSFKTRDVGYLTKIKLTSTATDGWYCQHILVRYNGQTAYFKVQKWVDYPAAANIYALRSNQ